MSRRSWRRLLAISLALACSFTACHVADPADYRDTDVPSTTGDSTGGNSILEDGHILPSPP